MAEVQKYLGADGQKYVRLPGTAELTPIDDDQAAALEEGNLEAFMNSVGNSVGQAVTGAGALMGSEGMRGQFDELQANQQMRGAANPIAGGVGSIVPDVAAGIVTGGAGTIGRRLGMTAAVEGGLGAARNPDAPVTGALVQGGLATSLLGLGLGAQTIKQRFTNTANEVIEKSRLSRADQGATLSGAPGASGAADLAAGSNLRDRVAQQVFRQSDPDQEAIKLADDVGFRLSPGQRRGADGQTMFEEGFIRNPGANDVWNREIANPNRDRFTSMLREGLGLKPGARISFDDMAKAEDAIFAEFDEIGDSIAATKMIGQHEVDQMINITSSNNAVAQGKVRSAFVRPWVKRMEGDGGFDDDLFGPGGVSKNSYMNASELMDMIRDVNKAVADADNSSRDQLLGLRDLYEGWLDDMAGEAKDEVKSRLKNANEKYRVWKTATAPGVLKEDQPSVRVLSNAIRRNFADNARRNDYRDGRGRALEPSTTRLIKAAQVQQRFPEMLNNSGTPTGQLMSGPPTSVAGRLAASRAAAEMYFGNPLRGAGAAAATPAGAAAGGAAGLSLWAGGE